MSLFCCSNDALVLRRGPLKRVGLKSSFNFDRNVAERTRHDVKPEKYEQMAGHEFI